MKASLNDLAVHASHLMFDKRTKQTKKPENKLWVFSHTPFQLDILSPSPLFPQSSPEQLLYPMACLDMHRFNVSNVEDMVETNNLN